LGATPPPIYRERC